MQYHISFEDLLWTAPEHLRSTEEKGSQKGDVYSFAIILQEIILRTGPYGSSIKEPKGRFSYQKYFAKFLMRVNNMGDTGKHFFTSL